MMKKIICLVVFCLMLFSVSAMADGFDLSNMTLDELTLLMNEVYAEIQERFGFNDAAIGAGYYTVGEDILAGKYELICISPQIETSASGMTRNQCKLIITSDSTDNAEILFEYDEIQNGQKLLIELCDNNILVLVRGNFLIQPFEHSWQP